jgi:hypothetical protein
VNINLIVAKITCIYNDAGFNSVKFKKPKPKYKEQYQKKPKPKYKEQYQKKHMQAKNTWITTNYLTLRRDIRNIGKKIYTCLYVLLIAHIF